MNFGEQEVAMTPQEDTCGPCHSDAACTHGCKGSVEATTINGDLTEYKNDEVVLRIREKLEGTTVSAESIFEEMKQFLITCQGAAGGKAPSKQVDLAWHEFILFTRDYAAFCEKYFGRFIHHVPTPRIGAGPDHAIPS